MSNRIGLNAGSGLFQLVPITATWALPFTLYSMALSLRVVQARVVNKQWLGDRLEKNAISSSSSSAQADPLYKAIRTHANFIENVPFALFLTALAEINGADKKVLGYALGALAVFRVAHADFGILTKDGVALARPFGYYGTQGWLLGVAGWTAWLVRGYWGF